MSVLVKGMEKPEHCGYCRFRYGGICHALQKTQYSMDECPLAGIDDVPDICVGDTISRQDAIDAFRKSLCALESESGREYGISFSGVERILKSLPSAQSKRMRGRWVKDEEASSQHIESIYVCSACNNMDAWGEAEKNTFKFCPNCGADMRGEQDG